MRKYYIVRGSSGYFEEIFRSLDLFAEAENFLDLIALYDNSRNARKLFTSHAKFMICRNDNYHAIVEQAHDRLGPLMDEITKDTAEILIHNPTERLMRHIKLQEQLKRAEIVEHDENLVAKLSIDDFQSKLNRIRDKILGQEFAISELGKSVLTLALLERKRPYVIMLHGESSVGKTELAKLFSKAFFRGKVLESHMSMYQNMTYVDYFFGDRPNRNTFSFDLYERESNVVLLDEIDKCLPVFYPAFYSLFDLGVYKDSTYTVDTTGLLILLTSNYSTQAEIKKELGLPIYYRIEKFIEMNSFSTGVIRELADREIQDMLDSSKINISKPHIVSASYSDIRSEKENARTIRSKVLRAVENELYLTKGAKD